MTYFQKISLNNLEDKNAYAVTIGIFDGLHKGHQFLLKELRKTAFENSINSLVITFEENFSKDTKKISSFILTQEEKKEFLSLLGIDHMIILKPEKIKDLSPEEFIKTLSENICIKCICVGENFRFGRNREGTVETLIKLKEVYGFNVKIFPLYDKISSSLIRTLIEEGKVKEARANLGYFYFIKGKVVEGDKLGRKIGFPTANIQIESNKIIPKRGIYKGKILIKNKIYNSAIYIGTKPTFNNSELRIEVHILDYKGELLGEDVEIIFEEFIREEKKFSNIQELIEQISKDVNYIRNKKEEKAIITIDGPAGSGKTTIAKLLAKTLGFNYLDSGALYRAVGWLAKEKNLKEEEILEIIKEKPFYWHFDGEDFKIFFKDKDISEVIRKDDIGKEASKVGTMPKIREILTLWQREYFNNVEKGLVIEGRDSGSFVFPQANLKLYFTANLEIRAKRRAKELNEDFDKILNSLKERDKRDMERPYAPLKIPEDSFIIDTSALTPEEILSKILSLFAKLK